MTDSVSGPAEHWIRRAEQRRTQVAEAILAYIAEDPSEITVADIAARAGISRPTFYKYFPTLGSAMLFTQRLALERIDAYVAEHLPPETDTREQMLAIFTLGFEFTCLNPEIAEFFNYYDFSHRRLLNDGAEKREHLEIAADAMSRLLALFREGQRDGSIDAALEESTFWAIQTSLVGARQRLLIESRWTNGFDDHARVVLAAVIDAWRSVLTPNL